MQISSGQGAPQHLLSKLDYITNEAMGIVTGAPARSSILDLYNKTRWLSLKEGKYSRTSIIRPSIFLFSGLTELILSSYI